MWKPKYFLVVFISHKNTKPDPTNLPNLKEKTHTNNLPTSPKGNKPRKKKKKVPNKNRNRKKLLNPHTCDTPPSRDYPYKNPQGGPNP